MALDKPALRSALESLFVAPSTNMSTLAQQWADALQAHAAGITPVSVAVAAAAAALKVALQTAFTTGGPSTPANVEAAFAAFAAAVGAGMAPAFVATPPLSPVIAPNMAPPWPATHAAAATKWSDAIDTWMRTGTATPALGGPPVPWS